MRTTIHVGMTDEEKQMIEELWQELYGGPWTYAEAIRKLVTRLHEVTFPDNGKQSDSKDS